MGLFSSIGSFFSSACSAISSAVSSMGSALSSFAASVGTVLGNVISALTPVAQAIGKFANAFLQGLGIIKPDEKIEELGERALQAKDHGITMDGFDNFDDYMAALRDFKVDPEISAKRSTAEKLVAGMGVGTIGVEDKFNAERGSLNGMWLLPIANPTYFTPERMESLVSTGRLGGDIFAYLEKRLSGGEASKFEDKLGFDANGNPLNKTAMDSLYGALDQAQENWADLAKQVAAQRPPQQGV